MVEKKKGLAMVMDWVLPGVGHFYYGRVPQGFVMAACVALALAIAPDLTVLGWFLANLYGMFDLILLSEPVRARPSPSHLRVRSRSASSTAVQERPRVVSGELLPPEDREPPPGLEIPIRMTFKLKDEMSREAKETFSRRWYKSETGGPLDAYGLKTWFELLPPRLAERLREAYRILRPLGDEIDRGEFSATQPPSCFLKDLISIIFNQIDEDDALELARKLPVLRPPNAAIVYSWIADECWKRGYESAKKIREEGAHNRYLKLCLEFGKRTMEAIDPDTAREAPFCPGLGRLFDLLDLMGEFEEGCRYLRALVRKGCGELEPVRRNLDRFCVWPAWAREIKKIQKASPKRIAFRKAMEMALKEGRIPEEAAEVDPKTLQGVARNLKDI